MITCFNVVLPTVVWNHMLAYIRNISLKYVDHHLYVMFGPVFDYDADGLADRDLRAAR